MAEMHQGSNGKRTGAATNEQRLAALTRLSTDDRLGEIARGILELQGKQKGGLRAAITGHLESLQNTDLAAEFTEALKRETTRIRQSDEPFENESIGGSVTRGTYKVPEWYDGLIKGMQELAGDRTKALIEMQRNMLRFAVEFLSMPSTLETAQTGNWSALASELNRWMAGFKETEDAGRKVGTTLDRHDPLAAELWTRLAYYLHGGSEQEVA